MVILTEVAGTGLLSASTHSYPIFSGNHYDDTTHPSHDKSSPPKWQHLGRERRLRGTVK